MNLVDDDVNGELGMIFSYVRKFPLNSNDFADAGIFEAFHTKIMLSSILFRDQYIDVLPIELSGGVTKNFCRGRVAVNDDAFFVHDKDAIRSMIHDELQASLAIYKGCFRLQAFLHFMLEFVVRLPEILSPFLDFVLKFIAVLLQGFFGIFPFGDLMFQVPIGNFQPIVDDSLSSKRMVTPCLSIYTHQLSPTPRLRLMT